MDIQRLADALAPVLRDPAAIESAAARLESLAHRLNAVAEDASAA